MNGTLPDLPPKPAAPEGKSKVGRVGAAGVFYFMIVFGVGLVLGPARVLWLEPWLGQTLAVLCEAPLLIAAMWFGARLAPHWVKLDGGFVSHFAVGAFALVLQQVADLAVGFGLRGITLRDQLHYFASPPGYIYIATLVLFLMMPLVRFLMRKGEST